MTGSTAPDSGEARQVVLGRIRDALADRPAGGPIPRDYDRALPPGTDRIELFVERVSDYRATVHQATAADLPGMIAAVLAAHRATRIAVPAGIPALWLEGSSPERVPDDPVELRVSTVGRIQPHLEVKIIDLEGGDQPRVKQHIHCF